MFRRIYNNSPVVVGFCTLSLLALIAGFFTKGYSTNLLFVVHRSSPTDVFTYVRLMGHVVGHANFQHFFGNISMILLVGPMLEEKYGSFTLGSFIAITALITGIIQISFFREGLLGASGIVFMFILLSSLANFKKDKIPVTLILVAVLFLGQEIVAALSPEDRLNGISRMAHIAGGVLGTILGYWFNLKRLNKVAAASTTNSQQSTQSADHNNSYSMGINNNYPNTAGIGNNVSNQYNYQNSSSEPNNTNSSNPSQNHPFGF